MSRRATLVSTLLLLVPVLARPAAATPMPPVGTALPVGIPPVVAVVGDSLTAAGTIDLDRRLRGVGWSATVIDAVPSRRIPASAPAPLSGVKAVRALREAGVTTDRWIVALGTNDLIALGGNDPAVLINELLGAIGPQARVVWVAPWLVDRPGPSARFLAALRSLPSSRNVVVADFGAIEVSHPPWLGGDHIHLTPDGALARRKFVADASRVLLPPAVNAPTPRPTPASAEVVPTAPLRPGHRGGEVAALQQLMARYGWFAGQVGGSYGTETTAAVMRMQLTLRLSGVTTALPTGVYDAATRSALLSFLGRR